MSLWELCARSPFARAAGWALFHTLWQGAAIAIALAAFLAATRSPRARYAAAGVALALVLVAFAATFVYFLPAAVQATPTNLAAFTRSGHAGSGTFPKPPKGMADVLPWLTPAWLAGIALFYLRHVASWAGAQRLRRTGVCCASDDWQDRLKVLKERLRLTRPVVLLESALSRVPVVIGHFRPVILMPVGLLAGLPPSQIEAILLHELAHIRRQDYLVNLFQTAIESLLFYHPLVWWMSGVMRREREHCCDDAAVAASGNAHEYALALAALEQTRWGCAEAAIAATGGSLVQRIRRLLFPGEGPRPAFTPIATAGVLLLTAAVALMAWQPRTVAPPSPYTKWVEEDVVYIITVEERNAFLQLRTDQEREQFIQQFWDRRDPTPGTPENEFKEEHYHRIAYANDHFSSFSGTPGWRTDRGRIYITFGPPDERDEHPNGDTVTASPYDQWLYRYIQGIGSDVTILFVDVTRSGDYPMARDPNPDQGQRVTRPDQH